MLDWRPPEGFGSKGSSRSPLGCEQCVESHAFPHVGRAGLGSYVLTRSRTESRWRYDPWKITHVFKRRFSIFINGWKFPLSFPFFWGACSDELKRRYIKWHFRATSYHFQSKANVENYTFFLLKKDTPREAAKYRLTSRVSE